MNISRWGSHLEAMVNIAKNKPTIPPKQPDTGDYHCEDERWWVYTGTTWIPIDPTAEQAAAAKVTHIAREMDAMEDVAEQLATALSRALRGDFKVKAVPDYATFSYVIEVRYVRNSILQTPPPPVQFEVYDEELERHTSDVAKFRAWITTLATELRSAYGLDQRRPVKPGEWYEAGLQPNVQLDMERFMQACKDANVSTARFANAMLKAGESERAKQEEEEALESIRQTLNRHLDQ